MGDGNEFDDALLGLPGFRVTAVAEDGDELLVGIETIRATAGCPTCGVIARTKDRQRVVIRDLPVFDRRVRLVWSKRRFACPPPDCPTKTWCERSDEFPSRQVLSARAGRECTRAVGEEARSVASLARWLGVAWGTVMAAVRHHGTPLVEDPDRVGVVVSLGIDETAFLRANAEHATSFVTGFVDLARPVLVDMVEGNRAIDVNRWLARPGRGLSRGRAHRRLRPARGLSGWAAPLSRLSPPGRRSLPRRGGREPLRRRRAPPGAERAPRPSGVARTTPSIGSAGCSSPGRNG